jgi:fused signal recognition particle receptor
MSESNPPGRFSRLLRGLARTRSEWVARVRSLATPGAALDPGRLEALEEALIAADCGAESARAVIAQVRRRGNEAPHGDPLRILADELVKAFVAPRPAATGRPAVVILAGVNGSGKTTTAGKLAARARARGESVILAAADTYRAAAGEQLRLWAERADAGFVSQNPGADPAAVVVDALRAARARGTDRVIVDTAGRLHTREPLMRELEKIGRVAAKEVEGAPHEVLLVLDACIGQNALTQARLFSAALPLTGLVMTKLDGTARGGVALALSRDLQLPIRYVGLGEAVEDLMEFSAEEFVRGLLAAAPEG